MKIVQATFGVFHHFELARELNARGHLERIYSTFPWRRLQREGVPREKVGTFPWVHTPVVMGLVPEPLKETFAYRTATTFDAWMARRIPECDALVALSGAALLSAQRVQANGGIYICDRGSTHRKFQAGILREEYEIWGQPFVLSEEREQAREELIYRQADAIVVPTKLARQSFIDYGHDPAKVFNIPYGVRLERFQKNGSPPSGPDATFEVLFVGSVSLRKGVPWLLKAFAEFPHPRKRLRIIGAVQPELEPLLAKLPQANVEFLGKLPQPLLVDYMSRSHVMVLPSVEEGLALVQAQALSCGCPVIGTTASGAEDLFTDGIEGFIVRPRSVESIVEKLVELADDPAKRERMSVAAIDRVQAIGGWHQYGDRWEALLQQLIGKR